MNTKNKHERTNINDIKEYVGGLGVRSAVEAAPSAYLASLHATSALVEAILPVTLTSSKPSLLDDVLSRWSEGHDFQPPAGVGALKQKS